MEKKNTGLKVLVIVLSILVVALSGYIIYDKISSNNGNNLINNNNVNENNNLDNDNTVQSEQYSFDDFSGRVFNSKPGEPQYFLTLWDDGKYMYTNDKHEEETLGEYKIEGNKIKLTYLYAIDRGENKNSSIDDTAKKVSGTKIKELRIDSTTKLVDESVSIELQSVNQPASPGGDNYYTWLDSLTD